MESLCQTEVGTDKVWGQLVFLRWMEESLEEVWGQLVFLYRMEEGLEKAWGQVAFLSQMEEGMEKTNVFHFLSGLHQSSRSHCRKHNGPLFLHLLHYFFFSLFFVLLLLLFLLLLLLRLLAQLHSLPHDLLCWMEEGLKKV